MNLKFNPFYAVFSKGRPNTPSRCGSCGGATSSPSASPFHLNWGYFQPDVSGSFHRTICFGGLWFCSYQSGVDLVDQVSI